MKKTGVLMSLLAVLLLASSCATRKSYVYLNDMKMGQKYQFDAKHEAVVHRDDRLAITVSCKNPELAVPFNVQSGLIEVTGSGRVVGNSVNANKGYRVDVDGNIDFPILGKLRVEGLSVSEVKDLISQRIKDGNYINEPLVDVEFLNFKYTVLGAVGSNGTFTVEGDRITLIEALAKAGDVTSKARLDRIMVIREMGDSRQVFAHDIRSKDIFDSPCYYLQQNDIVYVEPKYKKKDMEDKSIQYGSLLLSIVAAVCGIIWAIK